jgi:hypothetical protein
MNASPITSGYTHEAASRVELSVIWWPTS